MDFNFSSGQKGKSVQRAKSFKERFQDYHGAVKEHIGKTKSRIFVDVRQLNLAKGANLLATQRLIDYRQKQKDYKLAIDHLSSEYSSAKEEPFILRYGKMKLMVKRVLMQDDQLWAALSDASDTEQDDSVDKATTGISNEFVIPSNVNKQHKDIISKVARLENMSQPDVEEETRKVEEEIAAIHEKIASVRLAVKKLQEHYTGSKQFVPWNRYGMLKAMIKDFTLCRTDIV